jgi:hypothetical protein
LFFLASRAFIGFGHQGWEMFLSGMTGIKNLSEPQIHPDEDDDTD